MLPTSLLARKGSWLGSLLLLTSLFDLASAVDWDYAQFEEFAPKHIAEPKYKPGFQRILRDHCSREYAEFLADNHNIDKMDPILREFGQDTMTDAVVDCIMKQTPEVIKSKMASSQVLLGLLPSILATLGSGPQETGMLAVVGRRPLLALALAAGSPAVFSIRSSEYVKGVDELKERHTHLPGFMQRIGRLVAVLEFILAIASIVNIGLLGWRLGATMTFTAVPNAEYLVVLWAFLGITIHVLGAIAVLLLTKVSRAKEPDETDKTRHHHHDRRRHRFRVMENFALQFKPLSRQHTRLDVTILPESPAFFVVSWVAAVYTACHIVFGTLVFSSALFISIGDSLIIIARLMASAVVCRLILAYELLILRRVVHVAAGDVEGSGLLGDEISPGQDPRKS